MDGSIDVSKFLTHFGAVLKTDTKKILTAIYFTDDAIIQSCRTVRDMQAGNIYRRSIGKISEIAQPLVKKVFTHKGDIEIEPSATIQRGHKINISMIPDDLIGTYPGADLWEEGKSPTMQPFVRWALDYLVFNQLKEDHITKQLYTGKYVAHTGNGPYDAADALDGIRQILIDGDYLGEHSSNFLSGIGSLGTNPKLVYEAINAAVDAMPAKYKFGKEMHLFLSPDKLKLYWQGRELTIGTHFRTDDNDRNRVPDSGVLLKASNSMIGYGDFFITPPQNLIRLIDKTGLAKSLRAVEKEYSVNFVANYSLSYGFDYHEEVWHNVSASSSSPSDSESES